MKNFLIVGIHENGANKRLCVIGVDSKLDAIKDFCEVCRNTAIISVVELNKEEAEWLLDNNMNKRSVIG